jgi:methionine biosynthesis protein MetW
MSSTASSQETKSKCEIQSRVDHHLIADLVEPRTRVLDLGCGDGSLLKLLAEKKQVMGTGVEFSYDGIRSCVEKGLSVLHANLDEGLGDYQEGFFDYVIVSQTLQAVHKPEFVLQEVVRVGKLGIVSFPNFGYWRIRWELASTGRMPKADYLPYEWYDTPNIHLLTIKDFEEFCAKHGIVIERALYLRDGKPVNSWPNLLAKMAIMVIRRA